MSVEAFLCSECGKWKAWGGTVGSSYRPVDNLLLVANRTWAPVTVGNLLCGEERDRKRTTTSETGLWTRVAVNTATADVC